MAAHVMMSALTRAVSWTAGLFEGVMTGLRYGSTPRPRDLFPHRGQPPASWASPRPRPSASASPSPPAPGP